MTPALTSVRMWTAAAASWGAEESPCIINGIISATLLTKQMHKSHRPESIDTKIFNHVLSNDYSSHNAIIVLSCWCEWMRCQIKIGVRGDMLQRSGRLSCDWRRQHWVKKKMLAFYVEWQVKSGCQKMHWIFAVLFISRLGLNKSAGTCIGCPPAFSSAL